MRAAGGLGLIAVILAVGLSTLVFDGRAAFAVTNNEDGTLTITLQEISGVGGLNEQLAALGVRARAYRMDPSCPSVPMDVSWDQLYPEIVPKNGPTAAGETPSVTIAPHMIPNDKTLLLIARGFSPRVGADPILQVLIMLIRGCAPACVGPVMTTPKPPPPGSQTIQVPSSH